MTSWYGPQCRSPLSLSPLSLSCTAPYNSSEPACQREQESVCVCVCETQRGSRDESVKQWEGKPRQSSEGDQKGGRQTANTAKRQRREEERGEQRGGRYSVMWVYYLWQSWCQSQEMQWLDDQPLHTPASCPGALTGGDKKKSTHTQRQNTLFNQSHIHCIMSSAGSTNHNKRLACK